MSNKKIKGISIDQELIDEINARCNKEHRSFSNFVVHAIIEYLKNNPA